MLGIIRTEFFCSIIMTKTILTSARSEEIYSLKHNWITLQQAIIEFNTLIEKRNKNLNNSLPYGSVESIEMWL